jgi:4a-hydroxytetrahydrobiopterin dehydratase
MTEQQHLDRLQPDLVADALTALPAWSGDVSAIERTVSIEGPDAEQLAASLAELCDSLGHQVRVERDGDSTRFVLRTDDVDGVTAVDIAMASRIDDLVADATGVPAEHPHHEPLVTLEDEEPQPTTGIAAVPPPSER